MSLDNAVEKWIFISAAKYFDDQKGSLVYFVEGQIHTEDRDYIEMRWTGPTWVQQANDIWLGKDIILNILIKIMAKTKSLYKMRELEGTVRSMFGNCIPIINQDTSLKIGNLVRKSDIKVSSFGQIAPEVPSIQSTVEASYDAEMDKQP